MAAPEVIDAEDALAHAPAQDNAPLALRAESDYWMRVAQCMLNNASRIESMGEYVGTFEWALFAMKRSIPVIIHTHTHTQRDSYDVVQRYVPERLRQHISDRESAGTQTLHVAWCSANGGKPIFTPPSLHGHMDLSKDQPISLHNKHIQNLIGIMTAPRNLEPIRFDVDRSGMQAMPSSLGKQARSNRDFC
jgi:hypothetical protein